MQCITYTLNSTCINRTCFKEDSMNNVYKLIPTPIVCMTEHDLTKTENEVFPFCLWDSNNHNIRSCVFY